jgi:glyoxylase-like metal-dependent hydrolase (beta-lactamase superfamily II)
MPAMSTPLPFVRDLAIEYGIADTVSPLIRRVVAKNPSAFTFKGTGTYIVGRGTVAVIDPGPLLGEHVDALTRALAGETVSHILITHTHIDHSPAAAPFKAATGAQTHGYGPHGSGRVGALPADIDLSGTRIEEGGDRAFVPDVTMREGDTAAGPGWHLTAIHTPGHTSNHLCFALPDAGILLSGDHVMGWSTSVIAPPDGDMAAYMASLDKLLERRDAVYWPTHGPAMTEPQAHVRAFIAHRREREAGIIECLKTGCETTDAIVSRLYVGLNPSLRGAAGRSVLAHLIDLIGRDIVVSEGPATVNAVYRLRHVGARR